MFELTMENISKDYCLFVDGEKKSVVYSELKLSGTYKGILSAGTHKIQIRKEANISSVGKKILCFWCSALTSSYDENSIAATRLHKDINIVIEIDIQNESSYIVFDAYTNEIKKCSEQYSLLLKKISENKNTKKSIRKFIKTPIFILGLLTFVPLFILALVMVISLRDAPSIFLFILSSALLVMFIVYLFKEKFYKW